MGYFITTEPENAVPGKSLVSPKTHTPGSRLSNLGRRFYSTKLSRWLSRDPVGERGGINLYAFVLNNSLDGVDLLGLTEITLFNIKFYELVGGGLDVTATYTEKSCCHPINGYIADGKKTWDLGLTGTVGIGLGGQLTLLGYDISLLFQGPSYSAAHHVTVENTVCGGLLNSVSSCTTLADIDVGANFAAGVLVGQVKGSHWGQPFTIHFARAG